MSCDRKREDGHHDVLAGIRGIDFSGMSEAEKVGFFKNFHAQRGNTPVEITGVTSGVRGHYGKVFQNAEW